MWCTPRPSTIRSPTNEAATAGTSASYRMRPMLCTSSANTNPATGTPNTAPNPPASAAISMIRRSVGFSRARRENQSVRLPAICSAVPSRPTDPPNSWVTSVPR